jgi:FkbM family methyltransferase
MASLTPQELQGLMGEIDEYDLYHMRKMDNMVSINDPNYIHVHGHERGFDFEPDVIFDLGANIGMFTKYCRKLFPNAKIVSIEPDDDNATEFLKNNFDPNVHFIKAAIGNGTVYRVGGAINGTGEVYVSKGLGYENVEHFQKRQDIQTIFLSDLVKEYVKEGQKYIIKMDIEGAENFIFQHEPSVQALLNADYFTAELHYFANDGNQLEKVKDVTAKVLDRFNGTHRCEFRYNNVYFYATKK